MTQVPFSKDPNDDNITFEVTDASDLEWISVYIGPDIEVRKQCGRSKRTLALLSGPFLPPVFLCI